MAAARETPTIYKRFEPGRIGEPLWPARAAASWGTIRHPMVKIEAPSQLAEKLEARARARAAALALLERGQAEFGGAGESVSTRHPVDASRSTLDRHDDDRPHNRRRRRGRRHRRTLPMISPRKRREET